MPFGGRGQLGMDTNCDFSNVNFTVRSIADPHIIAEQLTAGTLNFGYTPHENWVSSSWLLRLLLDPYHPYHSYHHGIPCFPSTHVSQLSKSQLSMYMSNQAGM